MSRAQGGAGATFAAAHFPLRFLLRAKPGLHFPVRAFAASAAHPRLAPFFKHLNVFEKWRSVPRPHRRLLKNLFLSSLLYPFRVNRWGGGYGRCFE